MAIRGMDMGRVREGASQALRARFDAMLTPLMVPLYRFALGMTRNPDDAEDLAQEAVLHAWRSYGSFRNGTNFKAWLFRICMNAYIDGYRSRKTAPTLLPLLDSDVQDGPAAPSTASPEDSVVASMMDEELEAALSSLPDPFRAAVILSDMEGLTYDEIATALCVPVGTVRSRLFRGRNLMRSALQDFGRRRGLLGGEA